MTQPQHMENNVIVSFRNVKEDVFELRRELTHLSGLLSQAMEEISDLRKQHNQDVRHIAKLKQQKPVTKTITKTVVKKVPAKARKEVIIAPKDGTGKAHLKSCPFAKNIKKTVQFKTKTAAFKKGYKACKCLQ